MKNLLAILLLISPIFIGCPMDNTEQTTEKEVVTRTITETETEIETVYIPPKIWVDKVFYLDQ